MINGHSSPSTKYNVTAYKKIPCTNGFRCKTGNCLDWKLVCNNKQDCDDGSDEGGTCGKFKSTLFRTFLSNFYLIFTDTACENNPCQQMCVKTPSGSRCDCYEGYKLEGNAKSCTEIKYCEQYPPLCAQMCEQIGHSYQCTCFSGYQVR